MEADQEAGTNGGVRLSIAPGNEDTLAKFVGTITGPEDTPFANLDFNVDVRVPEGYPVVPPKMRFSTVPYHPNVGPDGSICVTFLKNYGRTGWSPAMSMKSALIALQSLLNDPFPDDPLHGAAAKDWRVAARTNNWDAYRRKVITRAKNLHL